MLAPEPDGVPVLEGEGVCELVGELLGEPVPVGVLVVVTDGVGVPDDVMEPVPVSDVELLGDCVTVDVAEDVGVPLGVDVGEAVGVTVEVAVADGDVPIESEGEGDCDGVGVPLGETEMVPVAEMDAVSELVLVIEGEAPVDSEGVGEAVRDGLGVPDGDGEREGDTDAAAPQAGKAGPGATATPLYCDALGALRSQMAGDVKLAELPAAMLAVYR